MDQTDLKRVEDHPDYDYLVEGGYLPVDALADMTDAEITNYAATERLEDTLDKE
jgi:hypothetical protein